MTQSAATEERLRRIHRSLFAEPERRLLLRLADRLPDWVTPDGLTLLGVIGAALVLVGGIAAHVDAVLLVLGVPGLALNWFGDSLDGTLARRRGIERHRYGFYIDQFSDVAGHLMILGGLGLSPVMRLDTAMLAMLASLLTMFYGHLRLPFDRSWQVAQHAMGPSELRILIGIGLLVGGLVGVPSIVTRIGPLTIFDLIGTIAFVAGLWGIAVRFVQDRRRFAAMDPGDDAAPPDHRPGQSAAGSDTGRRAMTGGSHPNPGASR